MELLVLPAICSIADEAYIFQWDNAPAHRARQTVELLRSETPEFIVPDMWPVKSPDLNWAYYCIRVMREISLPQVITGRGRSAAAVDECSRRDN